MHYDPAEILARIRSELVTKTGYAAELVQDHHEFVDASSTAKVLSVDLVAFAQQPPSYESSCLAFALTDSPTPYNVARYRFLGVPLFFTVHPTTGASALWSMPAETNPELIEEIDFDGLLELLRSEATALSPESVYRAKHGVRIEHGFQLSFFDLGLLPAIDRDIYRYLDRLLNEILHQARLAYEDAKGHKLTLDDSVGLFRLIFRFLAAKMLADRNYYEQDWVISDAEEMIRRVETHYFPRGAAEPVLSVAPVQDTIWGIVRNSLPLHNLSPKSLAYVYENTFVSEETRRQYDTHATPPAVAEYIVQRLPFEDHAEGFRYVFEPFCGHAPFLVAALGRLRALLPGSLSMEERHRYLKEHLFGIEKDAFASEVARYSLTLADYPNPNDWCIEIDDVFTSPSTRQYMSRARAVLCNPPFGSLAPEEISRSEVKTPLKAVEALRLAIAKRPPLLGFVLPRSFLDGRSYERLRHVIDTTYEDVRTITFPESTFHAQQFATVALIAHGVRHTEASRSSASLSRSQYRTFIETRRIPPNALNSWAQSAPAARGDVTVFSRDRLHAEIASATSDLPLVGELVEMHRGLEWLEGIDGHIYQQSAPDRLPGLHTVSMHLEPLFLKGRVFLDLDPNTMRTNAHQYAWEEKKVMVNARRHSRNAWTLSAAVDEHGLAATQNFIGVWAKTASVNLDIMAAVLSGPLANFIVDRLRGGPGSRDNQIRHIERVPYPALSPTDADNVALLVGQYREARARHENAPLIDPCLEEDCRRLLLTIDALILKGYNLSPRTEKALLDRFANSVRPTTPPMDRYYPDGFSSYVPLHKYISSDFQRSEVAATLRRLPKIPAPGLEDWLV